MTNLIGTYGHIASGSFVLSCSDESFDWDTPNWWCTYLLCIAEDDRTLTLKSPENTATITINKEGYGVLGRPRYHVGDCVKVLKNEKSATVYRVCWHTKRERFYYKLDYGNRTSTNWFFDEDIVSNQQEAEDEC